MKKLLSKIDQSRNYIIPFGESFLEARYVNSIERTHPSLYVSSQNGCQLGCNFCHLTTTQQTYKKQAKLDAFIVQLDTLLHDIDAASENLDKVNVNFMARGDPLNNVVVVNNYDSLYNAFADRIKAKGFKKFDMNISSIMPPIMVGREFYHIFTQPANIYYSLYSLNPKFRKKWMPRAIDPAIVMKKLPMFQVMNPGKVVFHGAFIKGENDNLADVKAMLEFIAAYRQI